MTSTDTLYRLSRDLYGMAPEDRDRAVREAKLPKRLPVRLAHLAIMRREQFDAGNMRADVLRYWSAPEGRLPRDWQPTFRHDLTMSDGRAYVVYSYGTPIAWERADGLRVIPPVSYSVSTARHQGQVRRAWGMTWGRAYSHPSRSMATL